MSKPAPSKLGAVHIPNKEKPVDEAKCQSMFWNLLEIFEKDSDTRAVTVVREILQTARCDKFANLEDLRESYTGYIRSYNKTGGVDHMEAIEDIEQTKPLQEEIALQAFVHYHSWTRDRLVQSLSWKNRSFYYTWYKAEKMFAFVGLVTFGYAGFRGATKVIKNTKEYLNKNPSSK